MMPRVSTFLAVKYQIVVMAMILGSSGISVIMYLQRFQKKVAFMKFRKWFEERINLVNKLYIKLEDSYDIEILHQYRVNLRKLHALNEIYLIHIDKKYSHNLFKLIKRILKPTSSLRDLDLFLIEVELIDCSTNTKDKLHTILNHKRKIAFSEYLNILHCERYKNDLDTLELTIQESELFIFSMQELNTCEIINSLEKKMYKEFSKVNIDTSSKELHDLRKEFKKFRYALDMYKLCFKSETEVIHDIEKLKELQDSFGDIQDNYVRLELIKSVKGEFSQTQFLELESYFKTKLQDSKHKLFR